MKKLFILLSLIFLSACFTYADEKKNPHSDFPPGFYEDIDPNNLDEDDEIRPSLTPVSDDENAYQQFSEEEGIIIPEPSESPKSTKDYAQIYNDLEPADFSYLHNIDPDQYYDTKDATWSIYPLIRLNSYIYFKNISIEPGYYLLTPREHKGKWYILFKQNGLVQHIIPAYDRDLTPEGFYDSHIPKPKLTKAQKIHMGVLDFLGNFNSTKRKTPIKTYMEVNDLENYFVSIIIYYGNHKYSTIFRTIRL